MAKIRVIRFGMSSTEIVEIEDSLESLQEEVGGYIEYVQLSSTLAFIVNEEGLYTCKPNRAIYADEQMVCDLFCSQMDGKRLEKPFQLYALFFGDFIAVGQKYNPEEGYETASISERDAERACDMVGRPGSALLEIFKMQAGL